MRKYFFCNFDRGAYLGFDAEEAAKINPLLVNFNEKAEVESVKYERISTVLVNAVKEQQSEIKQQQELAKQQQAVIDGSKKLHCAGSPNGEVCK